MLSKNLSIFTVVTLALATPSEGSLVSRMLTKKKQNVSETSQYVDELPLLPRIVASKQKKAEITMTISETKAQFYKEFPPTDVWGYNGSSPGPIIEVEKDQKLKVYWKNELPKKRLFEADTSMPMPGMPMPSGTPMPEGLAVTHLHGAVVMGSNPNDRRNNNDGWPDFWTIPGETQVAEYGNPQAARMLWYHDHTMGETARNVQAGLFGAYIIRDKYERKLNLPSGKYEIPLLFQAKGFNDDGTLYYPKKVIGEFYGNSVAINGKIWPYLNVEPRKYRFRVLNGSNARSLSLKLADAATGAPGPAFYQIGTDSGFLENTAILNNPSDPDSDELFLSSAERADIIIDFSKYAGRNFILLNSSMEDPEEELAVSDLMLFKVGTTLSEKDTSSLPMKMKKIDRIQTKKAKQNRKIVLSSMPMSDGSTMMMLNGKLWDAPVEEKPKLGSTEVWEIVNTLRDLHPFHVHLVQFQVLDRRPFDVNEYNKTGKINFTGPALPPDANEMGWKDVVKATPESITRIIMKFEPFTGHFVYHCHILEHEDMGMMRPFEVVR